MTAIKRSWQSTKERALAGLVRARDRWMYTDSALAGSKWPVRGPTGRRPPFFVLGSPRSGTTLLRAILSAHPDVFIPPENGALGSMIRVFGARRSSDWEDVVDAVFDKFTGGYEYAFWEVDIESVRKKAKVMPQNERSLAALLQHLYIEYGRLKAPGKRIWGDKTTPGGFHFVYKVALTFPDARYIHIVRDGRDCVTSCVRAGFFNKSYRDAAYAWHDNVRLCRKFGRSVKGRFHELRYEDLVTSSRQQIEQICSFLTIETAQAMLEHHSFAPSSTPDVGVINHHENVRQPISVSSLGKWQLELPESEREMVSKIMAPELVYYGYG